MILQELFQQIIDHPDMKGIGFSIVLDDAPNRPIVISRTTADMVEGESYLFKVGQVRFEVSDGPGERNESLDFVDPVEAMQKALGK